MNVDALSRARAGDEAAYRALTEPYRRELQVHCYRMLGSLHAAEDALQDTLLSAWKGLSAFDGRCSLRTWLYRIATNGCLNSMRSVRRHPVREWDVPGVTPPAPTRLGEVTWLEPYPDSLLEDPGATRIGPEADYEQSESISLAFVTALQALPPLQVAVLVLRDVLGFPAREVADLLETTVDSVTSALKRARSTLDARRSTDPVEPPPAAGSAAETALVASFVRAYQSGDLNSLVALLTNDVFVSMPPLPHEYEGRELASLFFAKLFDSGRRMYLIPTRANGQPSLGAYLLTGTDSGVGAGLFVLGLAGNRIRSLTRFEPSVLHWFGLRPHVTIPRSECVGDA